MPATITALGRVTLGGIQFTTDPDIYEPFNWVKRHSVHQVIGGGVVIQDYGLFAGDNVLHLSSGSRAPLDTVVLESLRSYYAQPGTTFTLTDWMGNTFVVFITRFKWWPNFVGPLYFYEMECQTITITKINSMSYSGL